MHLYSELTPPTAVTHSLTLPFTSASAFNLVVAKSSLLQIFATKTVLTASEAPHDNSAAPTGPSHGAPVGQTSSNTAQQQSQYSTRLLLNDDDGGLEALGVAPPPGESGQPSLLLRGSGEARVHTTRLVLVTEVQLSGTLTGLARVARANRTASTNEAGSHDNDGPGDYLLLSFRDAKLSLVEWDAEHATISTVSIHYYEQLQAPVSSGQQQTISHDLPSARPAAGKTGGKRDSAAGSGPGHPPPWAAPLSDYPTELMADPGSRCAALRFGDANLAVIPFRRDEDEEDEDDEGDMIMTDGASDDGRIPDDEWDEELDGPRPEKAKTAAAGKGKHKTNGTGKHAAAGPGSGDGAGAGAEKTDDLPFLPSYVLRLPMLDPQLLHPVHLAFLHEYRQPTFGVLSSSQHVSRALGRRDHLSYMVFTLDPSRGRDPSAVTTILSVPGLPQDLFRVVALPPPMGGALLVGANELVHVDQAGKVNGVAVNPVGAAAATARARSTSSAAALADQADLCLRLENCAIEILASADGTAEELLLVLSDGRLAIIVFKVDGRTVTGLEVKMVPTEAGGDLVQGTVTCTSRLNRNAMFVGCDEADSVVLGWSRKHGGAVARRRSVVMADAGLDDLDADLDDEDDLDLDDDDLYGEAAAAVPGGGAGAGKKSSSSSGGGSGDVTFRVHDRLVSIAPINAITYGEVAFPPGSEAERNQGGAPTTSDLQLVCAVGRGRAGALALLDREINPRVIGRFDFPEARGFWTMCVRKPIAKGAVASGGDKGSADADAVAAAAAAAVGNNDYYDHSAQHDRLMIVSKVDLDGYETSNVYALTAAGFEALRGTEFEPAAGFTIEAGTLGRDRRVIQVLKAEVRCYDGDLRLAQIVPMLDEETGAEPRVLAASLADPYLLAIRDDASIFVARLDETTGELEEVELPRDATAALRSTKWLAGCLYADSTGVFEVDDGTGADKGHDSRIFMFLLSAAGALYIYALRDMSRPVYVAEGLSHIPPALSAGYVARRGTPKETLSELLVADLGDSIAKSPYLVLRHADDDLTIYEPVRRSRREDLVSSLQFCKIPNPVLAKSPPEAAQDEAEQEARILPMRACANIGGYATIFLPGASPSFILKSSKSMPRVVGLHGLGVRGMSSFHTEGCERGFIYADSAGVARVSQLLGSSEDGQDDSSGDRIVSIAELGVQLTKIPLGMDATAVAYHPPSKTYVVGCSRPEPYELPKDDDYHREWQREPSGAAFAFKPLVDRGIVRVFSPATWAEIDQLELEPAEVVLALRVLNLEVSETTHERRRLVAIGTAVVQGEDYPIKGRVHVLDVVDVIPEPDRPDTTNRRLKAIVREEMPRGAVTALCGIGTQGLMLVAQGQKCMVRGLKEDGSLLPVAFMDLNCHVTAATELPGTGLCLFADAFKGVWFVGYTEEPYRMILFGKSRTSWEVQAVEFLPDGRDLAIVAADADGGITILEFDPEHPKTMQGRLLLHRTTFSTGAHQPTSMVLLPRTYPPSARTASRPKQNGTKADEQPISPPQILLLASPTGVLATLHPLPDAAHRRLSSLATALAASLPHPAGLNPRVYRAAALLAATGMPPGVDPTAGYGGGVFSVAGGGGASAKSILDGTLLARWNELGTARRAEAAWRAGYAEGVASSVGAASALGERQVQTSTAANGDSAVSGAQGAGEAGGLGTTAAGPAIGMLGARAVREELRVEGGGWGALAYF